MAKYDPIKKAFIVDAADMDVVGHLLLATIRDIRQVAGLPLDKYDDGDGSLTRADHAQKHILDVARKLGLDFGAQWGNELDVREL